MSHTFTTLFSVALLLALSGCGAAAPMPSQSEISPPPTSGAAIQSPTPVPEENTQPIPTPEGGEMGDAVVITLDIRGKTFSATLAENDAARELAEHLPLTMELSELHGNEKYTYLAEGLPTDSKQPGQIRAGDLMLYGSDCLVLFYESFASGYSYTRLGSVDDSEGLAQAVGAGSVTVTFALGKL